MLRSLIEFWNILNGSRKTNGLITSPLLYRATIIYSYYWQLERRGGEPQNPTNNNNLLPILNKQIFIKLKINKNVKLKKKNVFNLNLHKTKTNRRPAVAVENQSLKNNFSLSRALSQPHSLPTVLLSIIDPVFNNNLNAI